MVSGGFGDDVALLLGGLDTFTYAAGQGDDFLRVEGAGGNEAYAVTPLGGRIQVTRDGARIATGGVERFDISVTAGGPPVRVTGLQAAVEIDRSDAALDTLHADTRLGADLVSVQPPVHDPIGFSPA